MQGVEVIIGPEKRYVWRADGFYLEQVQAARPGEALGDTTNLVIVRKPTQPEYVGWSPDDEATHTAAKAKKIRPEDVLEHVVLARIPAGRYCFVHYCELDANGVAPERIHEDTGWHLPEATAQPDPAESLPTSQVGPDKLPMAPRKG